VGGGGGNKSCPLKDEQTRLAQKPKKIWGAQFLGKKKRGKNRAINQKFRKLFRKKSRCP